MKLNKRIIMINYNGIEFFCCLLLYLLFCGCHLLIYFSTLGILYFMEEVFKRA